jgi:hypothetical protein
MEQPSHLCSVGCSEGGHTRRGPPQSDSTHFDRLTVCTTVVLGCVFAYFGVTIRPVTALLAIFCPLAMADTSLLL